MIIEKKDILIFDKGPVQGLGDTTLTAKKEYASNFSMQQKKFCLRLLCNGVNSCIFVNSAKIYKCKAKNSEKLKLHYV